MSVVRGHETAYKVCNFILCNFQHPYQEKPQAPCNFMPTSIKTIFCFHAIYIFIKQLLPNSDLHIERLWKKRYEKKVQGLCKTGYLFLFFHAQWRSCNLSCICFMFWTYTCPFANMIFITIVITIIKMSRQFCMDILRFTTTPPYLATISRLLKYSRIFKHA